MASEKDPSIYYDRGTIGSSDELDEYGVWVKSEPQDLSSVNPEIQDQDTDFSIPDMEDLPDFEVGTDDYSFSLDDTDSLDDAVSPAEDDDFNIPEADSSLESDGAVKADKETDITDEAGFTEVSMEDFLGDDLDSLGEPVLAEEASEDDDMELEAMDSGVEITEDTIPDFDDVAAVSQDLQKSEPPKAQNAGVDLSTQLLMKIADELSSIRSELSSLKNELSVIRSEAAGAESGEEQGGGGFFMDEEDDEKIALTGDELDNILNTADFTEEAGSDATGEFPGDFNPLEEAEIPSEPAAGPAMLSDLPDIIGNDALSLSLDEPDLDEIPGELDFMQSAPAPKEADIPLDMGMEEPVPAAESAGDALAFDDDLSAESVGDTLTFDDGLSAESAGEGPEEISIDLDMDDLSEKEPSEFLKAKDSEELRELRDRGAEPMTPPPEDISYLEEDPLATEHLDLSGAVIDEPDLSEGFQENPIEEPSLDNISLDLDFDESLAISPARTEADDGMDEIGFEEETELSIPETTEEIGLDIQDISMEDIEADLPQEDGGFDTVSQEAFPGEQPGEESFAQVMPEGFTVESDEDLGGNEPGSEDSGGFDETSAIPVNLKQELKTVLSYMDQLLESLPEEKIEEFAKSEYFDTYKKLFEELGLV
jgi:hypothetical protein